RGSVLLSTGDAPATVEVLSGTSPKPAPGESPDRSNTLDVTIVLPCFNEQDHVLAEIERISAAMDASGFSYELMAIDDKSTDQTLDVLRVAAGRFPHMGL